MPFALHLTRLICILPVLPALLGCGSAAPPRTGFLTDYTRLHQVSETSYQYLAPVDQLRAYHSFIVEPVVVYHHGDEGGQAADGMSDLGTYFHDALVLALSNEFAVVNEPGPGAARVRIALTDVRKSSWWMNLHPGSKLTGAGTGQAAMEGELLDSLTGDQLGALVESQRGSQFELDTFSEYDDARDVIDGWVGRFRQRLQEVHGR